MIAEIIDKQDGILLLKLKATNPHEAMLMAECSQGKDESVSLGSFSWNNRVVIQVGGFNFPAIDTVAPEATMPAVVGR